MAFGLPKVSEMRAELDARFAELLAKLDEILAELRTQRGARP
jgi:hypothetical protein